jgi:hypothetical protein
LCILQPEHDAVRVMACNAMVDVFRGQGKLDDAIGLLKQLVPTLAQVRVGGFDSMLPQLWGGGNHVHV